MNYTGPVFRPPFEANSLLLQVTVGCSHNDCSFCTMYKDVQFRMSPMDQIEADLQEARAQYPEVKRIFLVNADPIALRYEKLKQIATRINEIFPEIETIAAYATIQNIRNKSVEQLKDLRALKINELNIGVESGMDEVIQSMNKGYTLEDAKTQLKKLNAAGMDFSLNIIIGAAGTEKYMQNAIANAELLNEVQPYLIFVATLHVDPGSQLLEDMQAERFVENTLGQCLKEEIEMVKHLELNNTYFFGQHMSNVIPISGMLPTGKDAIIEHLSNGMHRISDSVLNSRPTKGYEGQALIA